MIMSNPFSLLFGKPPAEVIERGPQADLIISDFTSVSPTTQINMISGVRGSGKTVFLTQIASRLREKEDWIVIDLNPDRDLLQSFAAKLNSEKTLARIFERAKINLSMFGIGIGIEGEPPVADIEEALTKMLHSLKKHGKRVLVTIDEASNTKAMREFISAYQIFLRNDLPVFLLMTGLYKNIDSIRNAETLTFLERAPRTELEPLDIADIAERYMKVIGVDQEAAVRMARATCGYSFAFQVLGYYAWNDPDDVEGNIKKSRKYLAEFAYKKIWSELSKKDREVVLAAAMVSTGEIYLIREILGWDANQFNPYRKRLIKAGIISGNQYGVITFTLPGFDEFAEKAELELYGGRD